jgi:hypothetical protein
MLLAGLAPVGLAVTAGQTMNRAPASVAMEMAPGTAWQVAPAANTKAPESDEARHKAVDAALERINEMDEQLAPEEEETRMQEDERSELVQLDRVPGVANDIYAATPGRSEILSWTPMNPADFATHNPVAPR